MTSFRIQPSGQGIGADLKGMMAAMMKEGGMDGLLLPLVQADGVSVMPSLVTSPEGLERGALLTPAFPVNTARMAARLSFKPAGRKTAVWLRPCEIRAFTELAKLNQASREELVILGIDCPMAMDGEACREYGKDHKEEPDHWAGQVYPDPSRADLAFSRACTLCTAPVAENADVNFLFYGSTPDEGIVVEAGSDRGRDLLDRLSLEKGAVPENRDAVVSALAQSRESAFEAMAGEVSCETDSLEKLDAWFSACINCYNCRNVCPVCYCRECVFNTDVFSHEPVQYHQWADKWGKIRLPSDTLFYHLTRLAHMSHACVGCGQCTRACPSDIPVSDLFVTVARVTQEAFDYRPGSGDPPPFTEFKADEYQDVVGIE
ncbi:MAG: 4Fe-4S dicluster domain-containing protein [Desulfobacter sp.]|nr:MAG: 4Fe-4S dicluster domain-containing protein [Desulfobacter sp.]